MTPAFDFVGSGKRARDANERILATRASAKVAFRRRQDVYIWPQKS
jgi:hypothetical protein